MSGESKDKNVSGVQLATSEPIVEPVSLDNILVNAILVNAKQQACKLLGVNPEQAELNLTIKV